MEFDATPRLDSWRDATRRAREREG